RPRAEHHQPARLFPQGQLSGKPAHGRSRPAGLARGQPRPQGQLVAALAGMAAGALRPPAAGPGHGGQRGLSDPRPGARTLRVPAPGGPPMKTRDRILECALQCFNARGEGNVSVLEIATELGISPGNLYYHPGGEEPPVLAPCEGIAPDLGPAG